MEVRNCRSCGKLFNYLGKMTPVCPTCMKAVEEKYEVVKQYIYDHPRANINEVSVEMEVSISQLQRWIKEERLSFAEDSLVGIECEMCGTMIRTGRFCLTCKNKMAHDFGGAVRKEPQKQQKQEKENPRMRFLE